MAGHLTDGHVFVSFRVQFIYLPISSADFFRGVGACVWEWANFFDRGELLEEQLKSIALRVLSCLNCK